MYKGENRMRELHHNFKTCREKHRKYDIIGDIHGCYLEMMELVGKLGYRKMGNCYRHPEGRILVSVGDISDKGPENLKCLYFWMDQVAYGGGLWVLGNHCNKLHRYLLGNKVQLSHGLEKTAAEFKKLTEGERNHFKDRFLEVYKKLPYYWILDRGQLLVVHGGLKQEQIGAFNGKIKVMCLYGDITGELEASGRPVRNDWAREYKGKPLIVYGHTVREFAEIRNNTTDIDQGCVYGGKLTAFRYPEKEFVQVESRQSYCRYHSGGLPWQKETYGKKRAMP